MKKVIKTAMTIGALCWIFFVLFAAFKGVITGTPRDIIFENIALISFGAGFFEGMCAMVVYLINEIKK